jgi:hypothetical protein
MTISPKLVNRGSEKQINLTDYESSLLRQIMNLVEPDVIIESYCHDIKSVVDIEDVKNEVTSLIDLLDLRKFLIQAL